MELHVPASNARRMKHLFRLRPLLSTLFLDRDGAMAKPLDGGEDVVGGLGPAEGLGIGVAGIDVGSDRRFEFRGGAMGAAPDLVVGQQPEEALDLVDPG